MKSARATLRRKPPTTRGRGRRMIRPTRPTTPSTSTARIGWEAQAARPIRKAAYRQPTRSVCRVTPRLARALAGRSPRQQAPSITGLTYERYIGHSLDPKNSWSPALRADGAIVPEETCLDTVEDGETCSVGGPPGTGGEPARITGLSAHELSLGIVCQPPTGRECVTGATQHAVWATMYGATVTLSDPTPPTLSAPSGALWGPGEGGFHKGTESIAVSAQDVGGGVASVTLSVDGHPTETYSAPCNFTFSQPCPSSTGTQTLSLATSQLGDGKHSLTLVATDAAGNQSTVASEEITVDNSAPPAPVGLSATPVRSGSSTFTLTWGVPQSQIAPITGALYQVCSASGSGACGTPTAAPAAGPATVTMPGPGDWSIAVWLSNAAGNANPANAAHASVVVSAPGSGGPGPGHHDGHAEDPCHRDAARARADRACERSWQRKGPRRLHRQAEGQARRVRREGRSAQAWAADVDVQARPADGCAGVDPRQRAARSRGRRDEHASPAAPLRSIAILTGLRSSRDVSERRWPRRSAVPNRLGVARRRARRWRAR